jgi:hypothetical protein
MYFCYIHVQKPMWRTHTHTHTHTRTHTQSDFFTSAFVRDYAEGKKGSILVVFAA